MARRNFQLPLIKIDKDQYTARVAAFSFSLYPDDVFNPTNTTSTAAYAAVADSTSISLSR
jgi:hypothetical protein